MGCSCSIITDKQKLADYSSKTSQVHPLNWAKSSLQSMVPTPSILRTPRVYSSDNCLASKDSVSVRCSNRNLSNPIRTREITWSNLPDLALEENLLAENSAEESNSVQPPVRFKQASSKAKCYNRHPLKISLSKNRPWACYYCNMGSELGNPYHCSICDFFLCIYCYMWVNNSRKILPEYIRCTEDHPLRITSKRNITEFYMSTKKTYSISCMSCKSNLVQHETLNHCRLCSFELCNTCVLHIEEVKEKSNMKCEKNHPLIWHIGTIHNYKGYDCANCKQYFKMLGSFGCQECSYHVCIQCSVVGLNL